MGDSYENAIFFHRGTSASVQRVPSLIIQVHSDKHFKLLHNTLR